MKPMTAASKRKAKECIRNLLSAAHDLRHLQLYENGLDFPNTLDVERVLSLLTTIVKRDRSKLGDMVDAAE